MRLHLYYPARNPHAIPASAAAAALATQSRLSLRAIRASRKDATAGVIDVPGVAAGDSVEPRAGAGLTCCRHRASYAMTSMIGMRTMPPRSKDGSFPDRTSDRTLPVEQDQRAARSATR